MPPKSSFELIFGCDVTICAAEGIRVIWFPRKMCSRKLICKKSSALKYAVWGEHGTAAFTTVDLPQCCLCDPRVAHLARLATTTADKKINEAQ